MWGWGLGVEGNTRALGVPWQCQGPTGGGGQGEASLCSEAGPHRGADRSPRRARGASALLFPLLGPAPPALAASLQPRCPSSLSFFPSF